MVRQIGIDSVYTLFGLPIALVSFVLVLAVFAVGIGLAIIVVGLPILAGALLLARVFADLQRLRIAPVLRRPRVRPEYRSAPSGAGFWRRLFTPMAQVQSWLDLVHGIFVFIPATIAWCVTVTWWAGAVAGTLYGTYDWALPRSPDNKELHELLGMADTATNRILLQTAIGFFFLLTLPLVTRACALAVASFSRGLLTGVAEIRGRIATLEERRAAAVSAEATALRRLERDIHDGPQQRLVRLAMELSRAQQQLTRDPQAARETLNEALLQTRETLDELRALSRGIAPPILADRGLPSALAALAGRCTVPVDLAVDAKLGRLDPAVENTAYFVVAEALANLAKHSHATECWLTVAAVNKKVGIVVLDDGVGGAHVSKGHGLAGLSDRVRAIGGSLTVMSPVGGPTEIRAELPC
jgi:signal transduction histidine kinase